ncbi:hypothetical protein BDQ17DRAFT_1323784 [Cyathus striatus]|nr:hypothetical protein BDQ17DRAFT_1323784 [Cyathus striatus]
MLASIASRMAMLILSFLATLAASQSYTVSTPEVTAFNGTTPIGWPTHWGGHVIGRSGWIRVDGTTYMWMGAGFNPKANTTASYITPTRSIFTFEAGQIAFNATFLSPIEPSNLVRQSLPFAYLYIDAWSLDGQSHSVQFYSDMTGEWLTSTITNPVQWNTTEVDDVLYHQMRRSSLLSMVENKDMAEDGTLYFAMDKRSDMTWQTGSADTADGLRARFKDGKTLSNTADNNFRAISDNWPVLGMRVDLGDITRTESSVVWTIGLIREPVIQFTKNGTIESRSSYFWTAYSSISDVIKDFIGDSSAARNRAISFDSQVMAAGEAISPKYRDLLSVSLRQTMASMDITVLRQHDGSLGVSNVKTFMKDIGMSARVNPVETMYAALPAIPYVNATLAGPLLELLLEYQSSSEYTNAYAAPDLSTTYPDVKGNSSNMQTLAIESCGNMLIMTLAHAMKSGDGSLILRYGATDLVQYLQYDLLKGWADYLDKNTLHTSGYASSDGQAAPNLSNLALKGIVSIYAMGKINEALETIGKEANDTAYYKAQAERYAKEWGSSAISSGHVTTTYGETSSWGLVYNLYTARLLGADIISNQTYTGQSEFYSSQVASASEFGFAYDSSDSGKVKSPAAAPDELTRNTLISQVHERAFMNGSAVPFPTAYNSASGEAYSQDLSPAQGTMFVSLALDVPNQLITGFSDASGVKGSSSSNSNVGAIVGGAVGGISAFVALGLVIFWRKRKSNKITLGAPPMTTVKIGAKRASRPVLDDVENIVVEPFFPTEHNNSSTILSGPSQGTAITKDRKGYGFTHLTAQGSVTAFSPPQSSYGGSDLSQPSGSSDLRNEVELLRREMAEIRANLTTGAAADTTCSE